MRISSMKQADEVAERSPWGEALRVRVLPVINL